MKPTIIVISIISAILLIGICNLVTKRLEQRWRGICIKNGGTMAEYKGGFVGAACEGLKQ